MARTSSRPVSAAAAIAWVAGVLVASAACDSPKYPVCENDEQCNQDSHKGVCVDRKCVECRDDASCGAGRTCQSGACVDAPGFCDDTHTCSNGGTCVKSHCEPAKSAAPAPFVECDDTKACTAPGAKCQNGHCVAPPQGGPGCTEFAAPKFDYESPDVRGEARATLERLAQCIVKGSLKGAQVLLTGHCDDRGEQEFNMSLGDYRAQAVKTFLIGLGVGEDKIRTSSRGKLDASGTDESGWQNDRRVDIEIR